MNDINYKKHNTMDKQKSIQILQAYATGLAAQSLQHKLQSKIFASKGYSKLGTKYADHATEEADWVDQFVDRIIDLGGSPKVEAAPAMPTFEDPLDYLKADYAVSKEQVPILMQAVLSLADDFKTYDILRGYALDEEEDMYWSEQQIELIGKIGIENWLTAQL